MTFRYIYLETLYLYFIFICCSECKTEKSNGKNFHGRYTQGIQDFELLIPRKINQDGSFRTYVIPHLYSNRNKRAKRETNVEDTVRYALDFDEKEHHIVLEPNHDFISPSLVIETHRGPNVFKDVELRKPRDTQCHYTGHVQGDPKSRVALSVCEGLAGMIKSSFGNYFIEPAKFSQPEKDGQHLHVIYQNRTDTKTNSTRNNNFQNLDLKTGWRNKYNYQLLNHSRVKRLVKQKHRYMSTLVVADKKFLAHHNGTDIETYILTIMNMVSDYFHDDSLGQLIDFVVVRLMLLEKEHKDIDIEVSRSANKTLKSFCTWQKTVNLADPMHPNHHDVAILLTRQDLCVDKPTKRKHNVGKLGSCSIQGLAYSASICNVNKSCTVNEDNGLVMSVVVTHELGHLLGCQHDAPEVNGCSSIAGDGSNYVMAADVRFHTTDWSNCSNAAVAELFDAGLGDCLFNEPPDNSFFGGEMLAGAMFDGEYQCRLTFGAGAVACRLQGDLFCATLMCRPRGSAACYSRGEPAADGTPCSPNKWCYDRKCVEVGRRPGAVDGGWGDWSLWSVCSRTCGGGVTFQERNCNRSVPRERGRYCLGDRKRYQTCSTRPCDATSSFRDRQCARFNTKTFNKVHHRWSAYRPRGPHDRCSLLCINGAGRHKALRPRVVDGTSCRSGTRDMCIAGRCVEVGCDWQIESGAVVDRCGMCRGDGSQCQLLTGTFRNTEHANNTLRLGRGTPGVHASPAAAAPAAWLVANVPRGARNVRVGLTRPTPGVVVSVASADGRRIFLNADAKKDSADGEFKVGAPGALGVYSHPEPYRGEAFIVGPTPTPLSLRLLTRGGRFRHATVAYSLALPTAANAGYRPRFAWEFLGWDACSARCGGGSRLAQPRCVETQAGEVSRAFCQAVERPVPKTQMCGTEVCAVRWVTGPWGACDAYRHQRRTIHCRRQAPRVDRDDAEEPDYACHATRRPARVRPCKDKHKGKKGKGGKDEKLRQRRRLMAGDTPYPDPTAALASPQHCYAPDAALSNLSAALHHKMFMYPAIKTPTDIMALSGNGDVEDDYFTNTTPSREYGARRREVKPAKEPKVTDAAPDATPEKVVSETISSEDTPEAPKAEEGEVKETAADAGEVEGVNDTTTAKPTALAQLKGLVPSLKKKKKKEKKEKPVELAVDEGDEETLPTWTSPLKKVLPGAKLPRLKSLKKTSNEPAALLVSPAPEAGSDAEKCALLASGELVEDRLAEEDAELIVAPIIESAISTNSSDVECSGGTHRMSDEGDEEMGDRIPEVQVDSRHKKVYHGDEALRMTKDVEAGQKVEPVER